MVSFWSGVTRIAKETDKYGSRCHADAKFVNKALQWKMQKKMNFKKRKMRKDEKSH